MNSLLLTDGYKTGHHQQYPEGTTLVYSNFTPRSNKYAPKGCDEVVVFGTQLVVRFLHEHFQQNFFRKGKSEVINEMREELTMYLGTEYDTTHFEALHDLGYLPIKVKALPEGTLCPMRVPVLTIVNTKPEFYWVTNYLETILSNLLWKPMTSATIAYQYKKLLKEWALKTDEKNVDFVDFQGHDFSMRGMDSIDATSFSGLGHLTSFMGTDSLPAIGAARQYYDEKGFVGATVPATEHSVMCAGGKESEIETFRRLLATYPTGILSVVSDTWDLWKVLTEYLPEMKDEIMAREGKLVIRPDSGDPVDIICGDLDSIHRELKDGSMLAKQLFATYDGDKSYAQHVGVIQLLWDTFGGTVNDQGYKILDSHIGAIYGDSITLERAQEICHRLEQKGFASTNIVFGIGSFTYQYNTRDTFGFAMKATYCEVNGEGQEIFKDPITDDGIKKSAKGLLCVSRNTGPANPRYNIPYLIDQCSTQGEERGMLKVIYEDGDFDNVTTLTDIRKKLS